MVFSSVNPDPRTYLRWHRFSLPTRNGIKDAVAVQRDTADQLNSAYTFLLEHIVLLVWGITVLVSILALVRRYKATHDENTVFSQEIWNNRSSPYDVLKITFKSFTNSNRSRWLVVLWVLVAVAFLVVRYAVPIIFARYIFLDHAAPVNTDSIYIPKTRGGKAVPANETVTLFEDNVPAALRSVGLIDNAKADGKVNSSVTVGDPQTLRDLGGGEAIISMGYNYSVTGLDMGLQRYPDLTVGVEGSCTTEYGWYSTNVTSSGVLYETYKVFGNYVNVSLMDGPETRAVFESSTYLAGNTSWAIIPSIANRASFSPGTNDPWYLTDNGYNTEIGLAYKIRPRRPVLSCWQKDVWSWQGYSGDILQLNNESVFPGMDLPPVFSTIFVTFLGIPAIEHLGRQLGPQALESASAPLGQIFDASKASMHKDLTRLVFGAYIATVNTLADTTSPSNDYSLNNSIYNSTTGIILDHVGDFVVWSSDVSALSVKALIIIPVLTFGLWIIFLVLMFSPIPGKEVSALTLKVNLLKQGKPGADPKAQNVQMGELDPEAQRIKNADEEKKVGDKITKAWETILPVSDTNGN